MRFSLACLFFFLIAFQLTAQSPFGKLPIGKYPVGFKVVTFEDGTRLTARDRDLLNQEDNTSTIRKISIHIWYPSEQNSRGPLMTLSDYCVSSLMDETNQLLDPGRVSGRLNSLRDQLKNFFGEVDEKSFQAAMATQMIARKNVKPSGDKFPLLIGMLRPFSTTITNEFLASHGFIVVMVRSSDLPVSLKELPIRYFDDIQDLRLTVQFVLRSLNINERAVGTFGFSGSGFSQLLYSMSDFRPKAVADLESGLFMEGLWQGLTASNLYDVNKLRIPFLHMFSRDLSKREIYLNDFERTRFSTRYQLVLNQPGLHHWDFATEGMISCTLLKMRGAEQDNIQSSFELANLYLLNFFKDQLKHDKDAATFLHQKPVLKNYQDSLWSIRIIPASLPAPNAVEFTKLVDKVGVDEAIRILESRLANDSSTNILEGFILNRIGYNYMEKQMNKEAVAVFKLNTKLHPAEPNWEDSLLEALVAEGKNDEAKQSYNSLLDKIEKSNLPANTKENMRKHANELIQKR